MRAKSSCSWLLILEGIGVSRSTLVQAGTIIERRTCRRESRGAATGIDGNGHATLPRSSASETEAGKVITNGWIACHCTVACIVSGDCVALVNGLRTIIWEEAELFVGLIHVTNLLGL